MKAKIKNCLNEKTGVFACWVSIDSYKRAISLDRRYTYEHITAEELGKKILRIIYVMRRHHYMKDFDMPTCSMRSMIKHDEEYAELMEWFVRKFRYFLDKAGYAPERGDGVGFCYTSDNRPFLMYGMGKLDYGRCK